MMRPLPLTVDLGEREPAFSFMSRLAVRNGLPAAELGADFGISFATVISGDAQACRALAVLGGVDPEDLMAWTPVHQGDRVHAFRGESFHARGIKDTTLRGCPACLRDDVASTGLPALIAMRIRGEWLFTYLGCCPRHHLPLSELRSDAKPHNRYDTARHFARLSSVILDGELDLGTRETSAFEDYVVDRLTHGRSFRWTDRLGLHPLSVFCDLFGRALLKLDNFRLHHVASGSEWGVPAMGYEVFEKGEAAIRTTLTRLQEQLEMPQAKPKAAFGDLYDRLAYELTSEVMPRSASCSETISS